ncbi:MAG: asparagine synthase-related protein, partial [Patescibacteria group bacterium]
MSSVKKSQKVFVGLSGGVDSSVAALFLKEAGYDVTGVFMKCWTSSSARTYAENNADLRGNSYDCEQERDAADARRVAEHLGIPFYVFDFEEEYKRKVVEYMVEGYRAGITPNPDVECNREIKFGLFLKRALELGADYVATGHYVRKRD